MKELKKADIENQKCIIDHIEYYACHKKDEKYMDFLKEYKLLKPDGLLSAKQFR